MRGYHYHNGVVFAAYCDGYPPRSRWVAVTMAQARRFGRARPATGFSMDLREVARLVPAGKSVGAVLAPHIGKMRVWRHTLLRCVSRARSLSNCCRVKPPEGPLCDRKLVLVGEHWIIEAIQED